MAKKIGLIGAISMMLGAMIGAAVFVLLGPLANTTGPSLPLAFFLGSLPAFFGSVYYMQLSSMFPSSGGSYVYTSRLLGPTFGILAALWIIFAGIGANGMLALGFVHYISFYIGALPIKPTAIGVVFLFIIINLFGIRFSSLLQNYMVLWMVGSLLLYIFTGLYGQASGSIVTFDNGPFLRKGFSGLWMATVLSFYSYAGYGLITEIGSEIRRPEKNTPRAIMLSLLTITFIYIGAAYVSTTVVPLEDFIYFRASLPMAASYFLPSWAVHSIALAGLLALFTSLNAMLVIFPQELFIMAKDGVVSRLFQVKLKRFDTPYFSLILVGFITMTLLHLGINETMFATMSVVGFLLASILMGAAALQIFKKTKGAYQVAPLTIPKPILISSCLLGIMTSSIFLIFAVAEEPLVGLMALLIALFGIVYRWVYVKSSRKKIFAIDEYIK